MLTERSVRALAVSACSLLIAACGGGGGSKSADWLFPLWVETDVKVADIDGDGRLDVITIAQLSTSMSQREGRLVVRRQTAPGIFAAPQSYTVGTYPWKLVVADIDGDLAPDLVLIDAGQTAPASPDGFIWMLRQNPAAPGTFLPAQRLMETTTEPYSIAVGDVNGDSAPDLLVSSQISGNKGATLLIQDAAHRGSFLPPAPLALPGNATAVTIGDLNGDSLQDIVVRVSLSVVNGISSTTLGVLYQEPNGTLASWHEVPSAQTGLNSQLLSVVDMNANGSQDIVEFFTPSSTDYQAQLTTLTQGPVGSFSKADTSLAGIRGVDGAVVANLDSHSRPDFATVGFYPVGSPSTVQSSLNILLQDGAGLFHLSQSPSMPIAASRITAGDLDGDGLNDFVILGDDNRVLVMRQSGSAPGTFLPPQFLN